jgi:hypothetical protein
MELANQNARPYFNLMDVNQDGDLNLEDAPVQSYDMEFMQDGRLDQTGQDNFEKLLDTAG